jgi:hypothetical protein
VAVSNSASCQVIGRQFQGDPVTSHHFNAVAAEFPGHGRQHRFTCVEFDRKHSGPEFFDNLTHYFNRVFFWQIIPPVLSFEFAEQLIRHDQTAADKPDDAGRCDNRQNFKDTFSLARAVNVHVMGG